MVCKMLLVISSIPSDLIRGVARMNLGMTHPRLSQAQMNLGIHVLFKIYNYLYSFTKTLPCLLHTEVTFISEVLL